MRSVKKPKHTVIAGAGAMGIALARLFAENGYSVTLWNRRQSSLDKAEAQIEKELSDPKLIKKIHFSTDYDVFEKADFVLESIAENLQIKHEFYAKISPMVPDDAILATNTSGLLNKKIAEAVTKPERFCGMHWWNPPDVIPLVEIVRGEQCKEETVQFVYNLALSLGKKPVIVQKDILGMIGNRLQYAVLREALYILETGAATPKDIDDAMKYGPGFRYSLLGPFESADLGGLHIFRAVSNYLFPDLANNMHSKTLNRLVDEGRLGVANEGGFFDYKDDEGEEKLQWRNEKFRALADFLKDKEYKKDKEETTSKGDKKDDKKD